MISKKLLEANERGITALRIRTGVTTVDILPSECEYMRLDEETGGVWYQLKESKMVVPMEPGHNYASPAGIVLIGFNR